MSTRKNVQNAIPKLLFFKLQKNKDKERVPKEARGEKHLNYGGMNIRITSNVSESMQATKAWSKIFSY